MTTSHCMKDGVWLRQLLPNVGYMQEGPTSIMCDNQGCIALAKNTHTILTPNILMYNTTLLERTRKPRVMFEVLSNKGYYNGHANHTTCKR